MQQRSLRESQERASNLERDLHAERGLGRQRQEVTQLGHEIGAAGVEVCGNYTRK